MKARLLVNRSGIEADSIGDVLTWTYDGEEMDTIFAIVFPGKPSLRYISVTDLEPLLNT